MAHVWRCFTETQVYVDEGRGVALEPARLERHGAATDRPFGSVCGRGHSATYARDEPLVLSFVNEGVRMDLAIIQG